MSLLKESMREGKKLKALFTDSFIWRKLSPAKSDLNLVSVFSSVGGGDHRFLTDVVLNHD